MHTPSIKTLLDGESPVSSILVRGWVRTRRDAKGFSFLELNDGSCLANLQCVVDEAVPGAQRLKEILTGAAVAVQGDLVPSPAKGQRWELKATSLELIGPAPEEYPLQKKRHSDEFLRSIAHLRPRTNKFGALFRIRSEASFAVHEFFRTQGFVHVHTPILTGSDCEGAGELFRVTALPRDSKEGAAADFFGREAFLTVSGQLEAEPLALSLGKVYTFGPTFRAENSNTARHAAEFWMIEPEMAFYDLKKNMDLIEDFIRFLVVNVLENCRFELEVLERDLTYLKNVLNPFERITYDEAVKILKGEKSVNGKNSIELLKNDLEQAKQRMKDIEAEIEDKEKLVKAGGLKKGAMAFNEEKIRLLKVELKELQELERNIPQWLESAANFEYGNDFGGSDETVLTRIFDVPVMVYNWPKECKAFYMKEVEDNPGLVKGVDVLAPEGYGEIVGG
ncbi:MAG: asparagine--tRNA ligase, partial [Desulfovibrio sp.]|nr:asparagine--tRNA ligase [Desulfovibrio sp.]